MPDYASLTPAAFYILIALAEESRHGYAIMKEVAAATSGEVQLNPGTLYTTIRRLLEEGLIREAKAPAGAASADERRRYYALTADGRRAAQAEVERLRSVVRHAAARLSSKLAG